MLHFVLFTEFLPSSDCLAQEHDDECPLLAANYYCIRLYHCSDMANVYSRRISRGDVF
jgi:hypothetical protein